MAIPLAKSISEFKNLYISPAGERGPCALHNGPFTFQDASVRIRPCQHVFGRACLAKWFGANNKCPACHAVLFPMAECKRKANSTQANKAQRCATLPTESDTGDRRTCPDSSAPQSPGSGPSNAHKPETEARKGPQGLFVRSDSVVTFSSISSTSTGSSSTVRPAGQLSYKPLSDIDKHEAQELFKDFDWSHEEEEVIPSKAEAGTTPSEEADHTGDKETTISVLLPPSKQVLEVPTAASSDAGKQSPAPKIPLSTKWIQTPLRWAKERTHGKVSRRMSPRYDKTPSGNASNDYEHRSAGYWT